MTRPCTQTYALRLSAPPADPQALAGVIEHVLSGERRSFSNAEELIAVLAVMQRQAAAAPG